MILIYMVFHLFQSDPLNNLIKFIGFFGYLMCILVQIYLPSYLGSRLSVDSDELTHVIFTTQWIDRNEKCKRVVRILVERTMRPMTVYAGGLFQLSMQTFLKVTCWVLLIY